MPQPPKNIRFLLILTTCILVRPLAAPAEPPRRGITPVIPAAPRPVIPLGTLSVAVTPLQVQEGDNAELTCTLVNTCGVDMPSLVPLVGQNNCVCYFVRPKGSPPATADDAKAAFEALGRQRFHGYRMPIAKGAKRRVWMPLFDAGGSAQLAWLEPGTYSLVVAYSVAGAPDGQPETESIGFDIPLVSAPVELTVAPAPPEQKAAIAAAKAFLSMPPDSPDFAAAYQKALAQPLSESLAKRVRWHAAERYMAQGADKELANELESLAALKLTAGEEERVLTELGACYARLGQNKKAFEKLQKVHTPRSAELMQKVDSALVDEFNKAQSNKSPTTNVHPSSRR